MVAALIAVTLGGVKIGSAVIARHRAQAAADFAALAAAGRLPAGPAEACRQASALAAAMNSVLQECAVQHLDVIVTVTASVGGWTGARASATARAGPAGRS